MCCWRLGNMGSAIARRKVLTGKRQCHASALPAGDGSGAQQAQQAQERGSLRCVAYFATLAAASLGQYCSTQPGRTENPARRCTFPRLKLRCGLACVSLHCSLL